MPQAGLEGTEGLQVEGTAWAKAQSGNALLGAKGWSVLARGRCDFQWQRLGGVR